MVQTGQAWLPRFSSQTIRLLAPANGLSSPIEVRPARPFCSLQAESKSRPIRELVDDAEGMLIDPDGIRSDASFEQG